MLSWKPKISVIMAVYNGMPHLLGAVESILTQTYKNFEFIIVDDASKDDSPLYLRRLKDKRVKLIRNKKNLGLAISLNKALNISEGNYIARMDADDISLPKRLAIQVKYLIDNPDVDICGSWAKLINDRNEIIGKIRKPTDDKSIKKMNMWITGIIHPTWFAKREVFEKLKYDPNYDMAEDFEFLIRAKKYKMANINKELILWRSQSERRSQKNIEEMYKKNLLIKWRYFKKGDFGVFYFLLLLRSLITTYLFPTKLKIFLNKKAGLI